MPSRKGVYWFILCQEVWEHISLLSYKKWALSFDNLIGILICIFISNEVEICDTHISLLMNYLFISLVPFTFHFIAIRLTTLPLYPYHLTDTSDRSSLNILIAKCQRQMNFWRLTLLTTFFLKPSPPLTFTILHSHPSSSMPSSLVPLSQPFLLAPTLLPTITVGPPRSYSQPSSVTVFIHPKKKIHRPQWP